MSPHIIELIFFAIVAIILVNKLINILGKVDNNDEDVNISNKSNAPVKDVTDSVSKKDKYNTKAYENHVKKINHLIDSHYRKEIEKGLYDLLSLAPSFDFIEFIGKAHKAAQVSVEFLINNDQDNLKVLVDPRFMSSFQEKCEFYKDYNPLTISKTEITGVYLYGNNAFIKLMLYIIPAQTNVTLKKELPNIQQEWTFIKNLNDNSPIWYLNNIDHYDSE